MNSNTKKKITQALVKKAIGYDTVETVEEFSEADGEIKLLKRKVTTKSVPPDVSAVKLLLLYFYSQIPANSISLQYEK